WVFSGRAGERVLVACEVPGHPGGSGLYYQLERADGTVVGSFGAGNNGTGQMAPVVLPASGRYGVRVSYNWSYWGEYRLRVSVVPGHWQVEGEDNNGVGQANALGFERQGTNQWARLLGYIRQGDPGDVFALGNLAAGTEIHLAYSKPLSSGLAGVLSVLDSAGNTLATGAPGATNLVYLVPMGQGGPYYARMQPGQAGYTGQAQTALRFDGGNDYVDLGSWSPGTRWTVEAWVRPTSLPGGRRAIAGGLAECRDWGLVMQDGRLGMVLRPPGGCSQTVTASEPVTLGSWYHVLATCDGLSARLYINGQFVAAAPVDSNYVATAAGTRIGGDVCCGEYFPGFIDAVAIWDRALTGQEIQERPGVPLTGTEPGLVGYWRFDEGQGPTTADASPQGRHGTLQGGVTWVALAPSGAAEAGLAAQYLLQVRLADAYPPEVVADSLPPQGTQVTGLLDRFSLTFSEDLEPATVNDAGSYELRGAGPDGLMNTADDRLWTVTPATAYSSGTTVQYIVQDAPLIPDLYQFTATTALRDRAGRPLAAPWTRQFAVVQIQGFSTEQEPNNSYATGSPVIVTNTQPGLFSGGGRGFLRNNSDVDFWRFEALAGDVVVIAAEIPGNPANSGLNFVLFGPNGGQWGFWNAANNGLLQTAPLVLTNSGTYAVRVGVNWGYYAEYRVRISLYRDGLPVELEPNNSLGTATALAFVTNGTSRSAMAAGYVDTDADLDYFHLGTVPAGHTVFLRTRLPGSSPLVPVVSLYRQDGTYVAEAAGGRPGDGVAEVRIEQTAAYVALVRALAGSSGLMSEYVLDVLVVPTAEVIFPNLQVVRLEVPVTSGLRSGDAFSFTYAVTNVGSQATQVGSWFDRVVLSADAKMDDGDVALAVVARTGVLQPGEGYLVNRTVNLPDGIEGTFYLIVKADYTDTVNEFLLEGDNETATEQPVQIALADYPDLRIEDLQLAGPDGTGTYRLGWSTVNRGSGTAAGGFSDRVRVRNQTTATTLLETSYSVATNLAPGAGITREISFTATQPGFYLVEVLADAEGRLFEHDGTSHASAEANNLVQTNFTITQIYTLGLQVVPAGAGTVSGAGQYPAGTLVTVRAAPVTNVAPYLFLHWAEGGVIRSTSAEYSFNLTTNTLLTAVFGLPQFNLEASNAPPGAGLVLGTGRFAWGSTNTLTAQPAFGYRFSHWSENGSIVSTNPLLTVILYSNRLFVAHYAEAHLIHVVTTATSPEGLAVVTGAGLYTNGQTGSFSAPLTVTNDPPDYYVFRRFLLNGEVYTTNASFQKVFATTDPTNMHFVAVYERVDATPPVLGPIQVTPGVVTATIAWSNSEPVTARVLYGTTTAYGLTNAVGQFRTNHSFVLTGLSPATTYHFRVLVTDAAGNSTSSADATFTTLSPPDLIPGAVRLPSSAQPGTMVPLVFTITNAGPGGARGPWHNLVLISPNPDGSGAAPLGAVAYDPGPAGLAAGAAITVTQQVIVPAVGTGPRWFGIQLDSGNVLFETSETNNTAFADTPLNIIATDLRVARVAGPASATFGQTISVTYVITNAGSAAALVSWSDRIDLSTASNGVGTLLGTAAATTVPLAAGASYTNTVQVTLPLAAGAQPGQFHLVVWADHTDAVPESNENNNRASAALSVALPPLPDLVAGPLLAPTNALPGQTVALVYGVTNAGAAPAGSRWSETVYLATNAAGGGAVELVTWIFTNTLPAGQGLLRTQTVTVPASGFAGNLWFVVWIDSREEVLESAETNNAAAGQWPTEVPAVLTLQLSANQVNEGASQPVMATVTRNGSRAAPLVVSIQNADPTEISVPAQVTIPAGAASATFPIAGVVDGVVDGPQTVTVGVTAPGYPPAQVQLTVLDIDRPRLYLSFATNQVWEGGTLQGVLSRDAGAEPLVVSLASSSPGQLQVPATVALGAGQTSISVMVSGLDDTALEPPLTVAVSASAPNYFGATAEVTILDDDWPLVLLEVDPAQIREGAGPQAARARLVRQPLSPRAVDVELESSHPELLTVPARVTIPAGETNVTFWIAARDNELVEGTRQVSLRHWIVATGSRIRLAEGIRAEVTVTD
ncbi:MAG: CARDB domain-containing protein, partial [Limisphaera sp.]